MHRGEPGGFGQGDGPDTPSHVHLDRFSEFLSSVNKAPNHLLLSPKVACRGNAPNLCNEDFYVFSILHVIFCVFSVSSRLHIYRILNLTFFTQLIYQQT